MIDYLISKDSKGKIRIVYLYCSESWDNELDGYVITRTTGMLGGKLTSQPNIVISHGKAKRTCKEQLELQYNSEKKKYLDKGYKECPVDPTTLAEEALDKILGELITNQYGVVKPMLAKQADKVTSQKIYDKIWYASRKIDGTRCLMYFKDGKIHTASRGGEHYDYSTTHITEHPLMVALFNKYPQLILDGELYKHGKSLQQISGAARMEKNAYDMDWLQYYIYDIVDTNLIFEDRLKWLDIVKQELHIGFEPEKDFNEGELQAQMVPQQQVQGWDNIKLLHDQFVEEGWEGCVIRDPNKVYRPNGRTNDMIKIKCYQDAEFTITGLSEGLREEDMCFTLITDDGTEFKAKPMGSRDIKQQYRENLGKLIGKKATVKFFYLSDNGTPLQPVLKAIRDYE